VHIHRTHVSRLGRAAIVPRSSLYTELRKVANAELSPHTRVDVIDVVE
jgi:hypothetical protein